MLKFNLTILSLLCAARLIAQTPSDAIMMDTKVACVLFEYNYGHFDHYWEGQSLRENQTIATVKRNTILPMIAIGVIPNLNLYVGLPHIKTESTEPNGGKFAGASGLQDLTIAVKYKAFERKTEGGVLKVLGTVSFSTPASNYLPDYMPYSLGAGAPVLAYRAIAQYTFNSGFYVRGAGTYLWKGYAKAEREYYYNNGSYYTTWMDVPNAITAEGIFGTNLMDGALQLELNYLKTHSLSGDDIRAYNAAQPTNKVLSDRVGVSAHYYFPKIQGLGVALYHNRVINGRNAPKISTFGVGLTYFFNYLKNESL